MRQVRVPRAGIATCAMFVFALPATTPAQLPAPRFEVTLTTAASSAPVTGRLVLLIATAAQPEPRLALSLRGPAIAGVDLERVMPGQPIVIDDNATAYPTKLSALPAGDYFVQAVINVYDSVTRADGKTVWLPMNDGTIEFFTTAAGNLYSDVQPVRIGGASTVRIAINRVIPPARRPQDTEWVKYVSIQSRKLTAFWGRPIHIHAAVLLPKGYADHPDTRYPSVYTLGHSWTPLSFRTSAPSGPANGVNPVTGLENGFETYKKWNGDNFPRVIAISLIQQTPYFPDSYSVNSANNGPYGDAIMYELIPEIERRYRGLGAGWARFTFGGSTGGWEAMAVQMFYPDEFNGAWVACPDPIDFRHYTVVDIYKDKNAYYAEGPFKRVPRPGQRNYLGHVSTTLEQTNMRELALGTHSRSGDQWDVWESVYSPVGDDGYPKPIWDKRTGVIDTTVAAYWREHFDLSHILRRDWATLGPKLRGKLRIYVGDMDNYYLNNAVYEVERFLRAANPPSDAVVDYGDRDEHCWNGDHTRSNAYSRLRYAQMVMPWAMERMIMTAPPGADIRSWRY
jgi:hypothetical protein